MGIREFLVTDYTRLSTVFFIVNYGTTTYAHAQRETDKDMHRYTDRCWFSSSCEMCFCRIAHVFTMKIPQHQMFGRSLQCYRRIFTLFFLQKRSSLSKLQIRLCQCQLFHHLSFLMHSKKHCYFYRKDQQAVFQINV